MFSRLRSSLGRRVVIVDAVRTPIGRYRGALASIRPDDLAAIVISELCGRNAIVGRVPVDDVIFGAANQSGEDNRNVGRMAALLAGLPVSTPGSTVNRLCGSGLDALLSGYREIAVGDSECVIVGGVESMSRAPFVLPRPDSAWPRSLDLVDSTLGWRLTNAKMPTDWTVSLGETAENVAEQLGITRAEQDYFALRSHERAVAAIDRGDFHDEIVAVTTPSGAVVSEDEGPRRDTSAESLAKLNPVFRAAGSVTAGNASPLNDGAAALLLMSEQAAAEAGVEPIACVHGGAVAGVSPAFMGLGPVPAISRVLSRHSITLEAFAQIEWNEAFAAQVIGVARECGIDVNDPRLNACGGAIALGHPLGASGARIVTTLVHRLRRASGGLGLASMCIGVGQGIAVVVEA